MVIPPSIISSFGKPIRLDDAGFSPS